MFSALPERIRSCSSLLHLDSSLYYSTLHHIHLIHLNLYCSLSSFFIHRAFISRISSGEGLGLAAGDENVVGVGLVVPDRGSWGTVLPVLGGGVGLPVAEAQGALVAGIPGALACPVQDEVGPGKTVDLFGTGADAHGALVPAS
jgi:hypothetical protein